MINCPECGFEAADGAKFCDRCGQGLSADNLPRATPALVPLEPGIELKGGYKIRELIGQTAHENRYRAELGGETCILREQVGPVATSDEEPAAPSEEPPTAAATDPAGPSAKTADLKLRPAPIAPSNGDGKAAESAPSSPTDEPAAEAAPTPASELTAPAAEATAETESAVEATPTENGAASSASENSAVVLEEATAVEAKEEAPDDLGEVFGRVWALSLTLNHPAYQRAKVGFADNGRVYLAYPDIPVTPLLRRNGARMEEGEALNLAIQLCQAVGVLHRRGLRVNDICPASIVRGADGRIVLTGLDYVSNDDEIQSDPIYNDGYTAPEIYRAKKVDKRADIFAIGALLYTFLTGERIEAESWREEGSPVRFYPPHVITPALEQIVRRALAFDPSGRWNTVDTLKAELLKLAGAIRIRAAAATDVGMVRELNEDAVMTLEYWRDSQIEPAQGFLYVIADGMGGAEAGEIASAIAVATIRQEVQTALESAAKDPATILSESIETANRRILEYQVTHPEARGMGSTAVGFLITPPDAAMAWVGDSRAYYSSDDGLRQLSKDHSLVQRLVEIGQITAEEARHHEHKNVITRSLGARPNGPAGVEAKALRLKRNDRLLLCSDGLTAHVEDDQIQQILRRHSDPYAAARELIVAANAGGGTDNVSVVVIFAD